MADLTGWNIHGTSYNLADTAQRAMIADEYDNTATYAVGDYCIHSGVLYKCSTAISAAEAWTAAHWTATTVMNEFAQLFANEGDPVTSV